MSKSHVRELKRVYEAIFKDALYAYPKLSGEFEKDLSRLSILIDSRGAYATCVDLPALGKHLDRCLSDGEYKSSGLPCSHGSSRDGQIPAFCRGLYLLVFDEDGTLKENYDVQAIYFLRQILYVGKKAELPCKDADILREIEEFYITDHTLPEPERAWESEQVTAADFAEYSGFSRSALIRQRMRNLYPHDAELSVLLKVLDTVSSIITCSLGAYTPKEYKFRHGPGAIAEQSGLGINKYAWSNWSDRLENVFPIADHGFYNHSSWAGNVTKADIGSIDPPSRLVDVPKTLTKPRLIAAEPSEHQWCQQNIWNYFDVRTDKTWIGRFVQFRDQSLNQDLALKSSADGSLATVDLSSASDRVTCHVVGQMFRSNPKLLCALQATRTRSVRQKRHHHVPAEIELRKFSTMGSACTFPVESLIFLAITLSSVLTKRGMRANVKNVKRLIGEVAVFGDDIIVPTDSRELLQKALEVTYFKVNTAKSFWNGLFRESCGVDAYAGVNVTPVYWHKPCGNDPESIASAISVRNNFYQKFCVETAAYLAKTIPYKWQRLLLAVPMDSGVCGLTTFVKPRHYANQRVNKDYQVVEVKGLKLSSTTEKVPLTDDAAVFQYFIEDPDPFIHWVGGTPQRAKTRVKPGWVPLSELIP